MSAKINKIKTSCCRKILQSCVCAAAAIVLVLFYAQNGFAAEQYQGLQYFSSLKSSIDFKDVAGNWARVPIYRCAATGVMLDAGNGYFKPDSVLTKGEAIATLVRARGLGAQLQNAAAEAARNGAGWSSLSDYWGNGYLQVAANVGILTQDELPQVTASRDNYAQRQEIAVWTARALGLVPDYQQDLLYRFHDWEQIYPDYWGLVASVTGQGLMAGTSNGYFLPQKGVTRAEMAAVMDKAGPRLAAVQHLEFREGYVASRDVSGERAVGELLDTVIISVRTDSGNIDLVKQDVPGSPPRTVRDFVVYKNGRLGFSDLLSPGDGVKLILTEDGQVLFVQVADSTEGEIQGTFIGINADGKTVTIRDSAGRNMALPWDPFAAVSINGRTAGIEDLVNGQEVSLTLEGGLVTRLNSGGTQVAVYQAPGRYVVLGEIRAVDPEEEITVAVGENSFVYEIGPWTEVVQDGLVVSGERLGVGDRVQVLTDGSFAARIEIEGHNGGVTGVLKGTIQSVNPIGRQFVLSDAQTYFYGSWYPEASRLTVDVDPSARIFGSNGPVDLQWMRSSAIGSEIYAVISGSSRGAKALHVLLKTGPAYQYNGFVDSLDRATGAVSLENQSGNLLAGDATIVIYNGKLTDDINDVSQDDHLFLETNYGDDAETIALMQHQQFLPAEVELYRGKVYDVEQRRIRLDDAEQLRDNSWDEVSGKPYLDLSPEAEVVDVQTGETLSAEEFALSRFTEEYDDDDILALVNDGLVEEMFINDDPMGDRTSLGRAMLSEAGQMTVDRVSNWSASLGSWKTSSFNLNLNTDNAFTFAGGGNEGAAVHAEDVVYVVHDMENAYFIFLQQQGGYW